MKSVLIIFTICIFQEILYSTCSDDSSLSSTSSSSSTSSFEHGSPVQLDHEVGDEEAEDEKKQTFKKKQQLSDNDDVTEEDVKVTQVLHANREDSSNDDAQQQSLLDTTYNTDDENNQNKQLETDPNYEVEKKRGNMADLFGSNPHYSYPSEYKDFGRRFVPQYRYVNIIPPKQDDSETKLNQILDQKEKDMAEQRLIPKKARPELVLAVAKESAKLEASKPINPADDVIAKDILRTGNYWNAAWKEDINPEILRYNKNNDEPETKASSPKLSPVHLKIAPESSLYKIVSTLKQLSPRLLYIVNT